MSAMSEKVLFTTCVMIGTACMTGDDFSTILSELYGATAVVWSLLFSNKQFGYNTSISRNEKSSWSNLVSF